ncbi:hypothetical protein EI94DRAFT_1714972 [Lactarius quietus]|nr:hypothetical protein EI94DRAFT_1714972 [Lactarius quietus]
MMARYERSTLSLLIIPQILVQIQQTAVQSQRALSVTRQQVANKERERRILQLTVSEIDQIEHSVNVYKGVGKMFMMVPRTTMEKDLKNQEKALTDDINSLDKRWPFCSALEFSEPTKLLG